MDLIAAVADQTDLPRAKATEVVDAVFGVIEGALKNKEEVRLLGFGTFVTGERKAGTGRNPRTGEEMPISGFDHRPLQSREGIEGRGTVTTAGG